MSVQAQIQQNGKRGMALVLVLIMLGLAAALASAFLGLASVRAMTSQNLTASAEAKTLAESGLAEAIYYLSFPHVLNPDQPNAIWTGVTNRKLDSASSDYYDVTVTPDPLNPLAVNVTSTAHIFAGTVEKYTRTVRGAYLVNLGFSSALMSDRNLNIPACVTINGNVFGKANVQNSGTVTGNIEAKLNISGTGAVFGKKLPNSPAIEMPPCTLSNPVTYTHNGTLYQALEITTDRLEKVDWSSPSGSNPMGVYIRNGNLTIEDNNRITGTLIVTGQINLININNIITAKSGFPALISQSTFRINNNSNLTINGVMIVKNKIIPVAEPQNSTITINGSLALLGLNCGFDALYFSSNWYKMGSIVINQDYAKSSVKRIFSSNPTKPRQIRPLSFMDE